MNGNYKFLLTVIKFFIFDALAVAMVFLLVLVVVVLE